MLTALDRMVSRVKTCLRPRRMEYFSRFGGLWTDRVDAEKEIARRAASGRLGSVDPELLRHWVAHGWVVLAGGVDPGLCDGLRHDVDEAWRVGDGRLLVCEPGSQVGLPLSADVPRRRTRVLDAYVPLERARQALFSPRIVQFLRAIFDDEPLLFQGLTFSMGSEQGIHQDTAYVVTSSPLELAAAWIALEDVQPGSGELMYYDGSHRLPEYLFSGAFKHWNPERDGIEQHAEWSRLLHANAARLGLALKTFRPRQGDVFLWSADLAHGGMPVERPESTRHSLVGHYCPGRVAPHYFSTAPEHRTTTAYGGGRYSSVHYRLAPAAITPFS